MEVINIASDSTQVNGTCSAQVLLSEQISLIWWNAFCKNWPLAEVKLSDKPNTDRKGFFVLCPIDAINKTFLDAIYETFKKANQAEHQEEVDKQRNDQLSKDQCDELNRDRRIIFANKNLNSD